MRVIYDAYGQMCNRLWEYLDQIAWAKKNNSKVISLFWDPSLFYFDALRNNPFIIFPFYFHALQGTKLGNIYYFFLLKLLHNRFARFVFSSKLFKRIGFLSGSEILFSHDYFPSEWKMIMRYFVPNKEITGRIDMAFDRLCKEDESPIFGVHIRRGDFRSYCDGRFYYSDEEFDDFMSQICEIFGSQTRFFISSNEEINPLFFKKYNVVEIGNTRAVEDMYSLSKCNYIIGPYSSFSSWASFYNKVPFCRLRRGLRLNREDFKPLDFFISIPSD